MRRSIALFLTFMLLFLASCKTNPEAKLHRAAYMGRVDEMRKLIDEGMDVNKMVDGEAPIHRAIKGHQVEALALLVEEGADLTLKDDKGRDAWELAESGKQGFISARDAQVLAFLLQHGYGGRLSLMEAAAKADSAYLVKTLVDGGEDVAQVDEYGWTPLHHAAYNRRSETMLGLLQAGADVNAETTKEFARTRHSSGSKPLYSFRYEAGSRPLDVAAFGRRGSKSPHKVLEEWGGTKNPEVDNLRKTSR